MGLAVGEIRDRAERFRAAVIEEIYAARAGRKTWPELSPLFEAQPVLGFTETIPAIERALAAADGEEERRLRRLLQWAAEHHVRSATARVDDEYAYWESTATVGVANEELPLRQATALGHATDDRTARRRIEQLRWDTLEEATPIQLDRVSRWHAAAEELGYGGYREATERLTGFNLTGLLHEARRLVDETEPEYADQLAYWQRRRLRVPSAELEGHDADWLERMNWLDGSCDESAVLELLRKDLTEIGLPLQVGDRVVIEHESFPGPGMSACCAPIRVPRRIVLLVTPTITRPGCFALMREVGRALHYAYTDRRLPFEYRALGDMSVVEAHGWLFGSLGGSRAWVRRLGPMGSHQFDEYLRLVAFLDLYHVRRSVSQLQFDLELADSDRPAEMGERWAELLRGATAFGFDPRGYLARLGQRFGVARYLRGRMLAAQLARELRQRFDEDWFRNPSTGSFLEEWLGPGLQYSAVELAAELGEDRLCADALLGSIRERLV